MTPHPVDIGSASRRLAKATIPVPPRCGCYRTGGIARATGRLPPPTCGSNTRTPELGAALIDEREHAPRGVRGGSDKPSDIRILAVAEDFVVFRGDADLHDGTVMSVQHDGDHVRVIIRASGRSPKRLLRPRRARRVRHVHQPRSSHRLSAPVGPPIFK